MVSNAQDGIPTIGAFLARLAGRSAQDVMPYMTIPSTIFGGPSIFQVRMGTGDILSSGDQADLLVAFYEHSFAAHIEHLRPGGIVIYDTTMSHSMPPVRISPPSVCRSPVRRSKPWVAQPRKRGKPFSSSICSVVSLISRSPNSPLSSANALASSVKTSCATPCWPSTPATRGPLQTSAIYTTHSRPTPTPPAIRKSLPTATPQ
ncbi:MAG: 2-oxoacid:acceptor oxidoreductase family protein [Candidatus Synoicihabitans palmerolidicus]|nr:2-oxoacid:acceptor oxidoreductase family protein [Candidatus Synoicihabitans palmerolidicus]